IKVGSSPAWLVDRLEAVGSRSINNVVDATNFVLWELGHPTHAFDLAKLEGNSVVVRRARPGEVLVTLDGVERRLADSMTVIGDAMHAVAVAGVMGGRDSEVTDATTDVFLEVASFDPARTRATRRQLGLATDASYRFERGVDPEGAADALDRCARLIIATAGGSIAGAPLDLYPSPPASRIASLRAARVARVLGTTVPMDKAARILRSLGCAVKPAGNDTVEVTPPSWRTDLVDEIDLIEEVARLHGYAAIPAELRGGRPSAVPDDPQWLVSDRVRSELVAAGLLEVRPLPFVAGTDFGYVRVTNPLAENESFLRRDVLETLARRAEHNLSHMQGNIRIFEIGAAFAPRPDALPLEDLRVACLVMGDRDPAHFTAPKPFVIDEWDAKRIAEVILRAAAGGRPAEVRQAASGDADRLWDLVVAGETLGHVSRVALDAPVWAAPAFGIELSLGTVASEDVAAHGTHAHSAHDVTPPDRRFAPFRGLPVTPASEFDLALLVRDDQKAAEVEGVIRKAAGDLLESLTVFDSYTGKGVPAGYRSLAWRLVLRHPERTLRDKEIDGRRARILSTLATELDVRQRTA
ncbi:MAG: phenylalanine--tRNA ligase subunit beta, partial [Gemmatimonadaceae bacterium]|nr:phenylalanine--tRNA ligase subunit beta [Gemmatimonadaceae bacterium]